jgi:hypothetical protein
VPIGVLVGDVAWSFTWIGLIAGISAIATSKVENDLQKSFTKFDTFLILTGTRLFGLGLGQLISRMFIS